MCVCVCVSESVRVAPQSFSEEGFASCWFALSLLFVHVSVGNHIAFSTKSLST